MTLVRAQGSQCRSSVTMAAMSASLLACFAARRRLQRCADNGFDWSSPCLQSWRRLHVQPCCRSVREWSAHGRAKGWGRDPGEKDNMRSSCKLCWNAIDFAVWVRPTPQALKVLWTGRESDCVSTKTANDQVTSPGHASDKDRPR